MRITRVETLVVRLPVDPTGKGGIGEWAIVLIHTDQGLQGLGRGGDPRVIARDLAPLLIGRDPLSIARLWEQMYEAVWRGPGRSAMSSIGALDVALWDLCGKICGQPVWRLLGGYRDKIPVYADGAGYQNAPDQSPQGIATQVKKFVDLGYDAVKIHMYQAANPAEVVARVQRSRELIGPRKKLMIDVHHAWDGDEAVATARQLEDYQLYWIEEPVRQDDELYYMRKVQEVTSALVVGGEGEGTLHGIRRLLEEEALEVVQTDILTGGGYTGLKRIAALAQAFDVPISPHGAQYPDINCHLMAAVPNSLIMSACPASESYQIWSRMYNPPLKVENGHIAMREQPGLGLELDWEFVERHRV